MAGLAGIARFSGAPDLGPLAAMTRALDARGPEARFEARFAHGAVGVTGSEGPSWDSSERWCVAVDSDWANARPLRQELTARDRTGLDSSAGIAASIFAELGFERGVLRLRGDVAIVAWDAVDRQLWVARDRTGQRPMYWASLADGAFLFGSEAKALLRHPALPRRVDAEAIARLLVLGVMPSPRTPWRDLHKLSAGCALRVDAAGIRELRYWEGGANPPGAHGARHQWALSARFATELAFQQRAGGEHAPAVALTEGVFSAALLASVQARRRDSDVLALSVGIDDEAHASARQLAARAKAGHVGITLHAGDLPELLAEIAAQVDEPVADPAFLGRWVMARTAWARGHRTILSGDGGAALFGGRRRSLAERGRSAIRRAARVPWARRCALGRAGVLPADATAQVWSEVDALAAACPTADAAGGAAWLDRGLWVADGAFLDADRAAGAHGIRGASPFGDPDLVTFISGIPAGHLLGAQLLGPGALFPEALAERLPGDVPAPEPLPIAAWLTGGGLLDGLEEALEGIAAADGVRRLRAELDGGSAAAARRLWALLAVARWRVAWGG